MNGDGLNRAPADPPGGPFVRLYRPGTVGRNVEGILLGAYVSAIWTHWVQGHTLPCIVHHGHLADRICPACKAGFRKRWAGYIDILEARRGGTGVLMVTPGMAKSCPILATGEGGVCLRGKRFRARREGHHATGRCIVQLEDHLPHYHPDIPPSFDPLAVMRRIWQVGEDDYAP